MNPPSPPSLAGTSASGERGRASLAGVVIVRRVRRGRDVDERRVVRARSREKRSRRDKWFPSAREETSDGVRPFAGGVRRAVGAVRYMNLSSSSSSSSFVPGRRGCARCRRRRTRRARRRASGHEGAKFLGVLVRTETTSLARFELSLRADVSCGHDLDGVFVVETLWPLLVREAAREASSRRSSRRWSVVFVWIFVNARWRAPAGFGRSRSGRILETHERLEDAPHDVVFEHRR